MLYAIIWRYPPFIEERVDEFPFDWVVGEGRDAVQVLSTAVRQDKIQDHETDTAEPSQPGPAHLNNTEPYLWEVTGSQSEGKIPAVCNMCSGSF